MSKWKWGKTDKKTSGVHGIHLSVAFNCSQGEVWNPIVCKVSLTWPGHSLPPRPPPSPSSIQSLMPQQARSTLMSLVNSVLSHPSACWVLSLKRSWPSSHPFHLFNAASNLSVPSWKVTWTAKISQASGPQAALLGACSLGPWPISIRAHNTGWLMNPGLGGCCPCLPLESAPHKWAPRLSRWPLLPRASHRALFIVQRWWIDEQMKDWINEGLYHW